VPFQYLPYAGGSNTIRGFREFRFRGGKLMLANVEYRFEAFIGLDMALFGDLGQVARTWDSFRTSDFRWSYGGGLRFNTAQSVFLRFDIGHSEEGTRVYLKFSNVF
jgi:outer membrane protein assembly factor BamA